jgi:carbonic anhydrase/acetyltransferase-like protein (isoleucine patch superfamily)
MSIVDQKPSVAGNAFVAPCASVIGTVNVKEQVNVLLLLSFFFSLLHHEASISFSSYD